ncbi:hypothetical protein CONPUDRAFT_168527 [Coniophora puteana RWD-64-598 SS2]|uniref:Cysteine-rich protein 1 n=1 Tax=Coniophora puteana (strain RWD-64-598) TaxID=741705 RepID=A0A5M3MD02_CONPW|nr:uncharacterized protein CONPUDRAFT_168527 [Coniophora puteana RWD-64-598 SS2]EIW76720.1 hypothetical protein CONPUDRAFT_168527 [Coniophora puteana RWD-64-598 SS2]
MHPFGGTPVCPRCEKVVYAAEQAMGPGRRLYHKPCLACTSCNKRLDSYTLLEHDEQPYCKNCHVRLFGTRDLRQANFPYKADPSRLTSPSSSPAPLPTSPTSPNAPLRSRTYSSPNSPPQPPQRAISPTPYASQQQRRALSPPPQSSSAQPILKATVRYGRSPSIVQNSLPSVADEQAGGEGSGTVSPPRRTTSPVYGVRGAMSPKRTSFAHLKGGTGTHIITNGNRNGNGNGTDSGANSTNGDTHSTPAGDAEAEAEAEAEVDVSTSPVTSSIDEIVRSPVRFSATTLGRAYSSGAGVGAGLGVGATEPVRAHVTGNMPLRQNTIGTRYGAALGGGGGGTPGHSPKSFSIGGTPVCPRCGKNVYFAEQMKMVGKTWHKGCLRCVECNTLLDSKRLNDRDGDPVCNRCYAKLHGPQAGGYSLAGKVGG